MNTENYRLIPNEEYERLVGLANLHEKAIKEVVQETIGENEKAYNEILTACHKNHYRLFKIKTQLDSIVMFIESYHAKTFISAKVINLIDKYIEKLER